MFTIAQPGLVYTYMCVCIYIRCMLLPYYHVSIDQTLHVANKYTWCMRKPKLSDLVINFDIWNFTDKVRTYVCMQFMILHITIPQSIYILSVYNIIYSWLATAYVSIFIVRVNLTLSVSVSLVMLHCTYYAGNSVVMKIKELVN